MSDDLFAPPGGWRVRIIDLSGGNPDTDDVVEEIDGFPTVMAANAFARAYVRDSVELCRADDDMPATAVAQRWFSFGEDVRVLDAAGAVHEGGWRSETELDRFAAVPAGAVERDWRALDPRRDDDPADEPGGNEGDASS